jgi:hypothetical protein
MWSDRETEQDCLGYATYVTVLADLCVHKDLAPLTLGIFGSWGSGKTSLMRMLKRHVDGEMGNDKRFKTLWFNAWKYEGREEAQSALIHAILERLKDEIGLVDEAKRLMGKLKNGASVLKLGKALLKSAITLTPQVDEFLGAFSNESDKVAETMESFESDFKALLGILKVERIVVFIDDLDRCSSAKVIETFETIKLFLNTPSCAFVIGAEPTKIQDAVGEVYSVTDRQRRRDYLEKIVQIPFSIPEQDLRDITCYVGMLIIGRHLDEASWPSLGEARPAFYAAENGIETALCQWPGENPQFLGGRANDVVAELKEVLPFVVTLARGLRGNPRQIKRFLNILSLRRQLASANNLIIDPATLIKVGVLEYAWEDFFDAVRETVDPSTGRSPLLEEIANAAKDKKVAAMESQLLAESLERTGLVEYLSEAPALDGSVDLRPYLFLAQTSLSRGQVPAIMPADEKAQTLARVIEGEDQLRAKAGAQQAAAQDPTLVASVIRVLLNDLPTATDPLTKRRILGGLDVLCRRHPSQYTVAVKGVAQIDPTGNDALAIEGGAFMESAQRAGARVDDALIERFTKSSKFAEALAVRKPQKGK